MTAHTGGTQVSAAALASFISAAGSCADEMLSNASFISSEFPSLSLPPSHVASIEQVCSSLIDTKHDVISELYELDDLLSEPASEVVQRRVERIHRWLGEELP